MWAGQLASALKAPLHHSYVYSFYNLTLPLLKGPCSDTSRKLGQHQSFLSSGKCYAFESPFRVCRPSFPSGSRAKVQLCAGLVGRQPKIGLEGGVWGGVTLRRICHRLREAHGSPVSSEWQPSSLRASSLVLANCLIWSQWSFASAHRHTELRHFPSTNHSFQWALPVGLEQVRRIHWGHSQPSGFAWQF